MFLNPYKTSHIKIEAPLIAHKIHSEVIAPNPLTLPSVTNGHWPFRICQATHNSRKDKNKIRQITYSTAIRVVYEHLEWYVGAAVEGRVGEGVRTE